MQWAMPILRKLERRVRMQAHLCLASVRRYTASKVSIVLGLIVLYGAGAGRANAANLAFDTASNYAPNSWQWNQTGDPPLTAPNLGSGFYGWEWGEVPTQHNGTYLDTSSPITSGGYSWGMYANGGNGDGFMLLGRDFTGNNSPLENETFSIDLASDGVSNGSGGSPDSLFELDLGDISFYYYTATGTDNMVLAVNQNTFVTPVHFSDLHNGIHVSLTVGDESSASPFVFTVTPVAGGLPLTLILGL
jgi:hypothetical protein